MTGKDKHKVWCDTQIPGFHLPCNCKGISDRQHENEVILRVTDAYIDEELAHKQTRRELEDAQVHGAVSDWAAAEWKERYDRLRAWIYEIHGYSATCDWGNCEGATIGLRGSPDIGAIQDWLCVCQMHYDEAPEDERLYLG